MELASLPLVPGQHFGGKTAGAEADDGGNENGLKR